MNPNQPLNRENRAMLGLVVALALGLSSTSLFAQEVRSTGGKHDQKIAQIVHSHDHLEGFDTGTGNATCVSLPTYSVMFDGGIDSAGLQRFLKNMPEEDLNPGGGLRFQLHGSFWFQTAGDPTIPVGEPFFLTYSFVTDGVNIPATSFDGDAGAAGSNLFATMDSEFPGGMEAFQDVVRLAFDQWQEVTNIRYIEVPDDGAAWGTDGVLPTPTNVGRGDIRIAMRPVDGAVGQNVLAFNRYPNNGGDMVLDSDNMAKFTDATNNFRALRNVLLHEHGHGLGIKHVMPTDNTKLMEPLLNTNFDGPQEDDIRAAMALYGDPAESNNSADQATPLGSLAANQAAALNTNYEMAIERSGAEDWYKFNAPAGTQLNITVTPIGTVYDSGPQPLDEAAPVITEEIDAAAARDLSLALFLNGQLLAQSASGGLGEAETITISSAPASGLYKLRVAANDGRVDVQRYALSVSRNSEPEIDVVAQNPTQVDLPSGGQYNFGQVTVNTDRHAFFTIENNGGGVLNLTNNPSIAIFGTNAGDFTVNLQPTTISIAQGDPVAFNVGFRPSAAGTRTATVLISNDDVDESAYTFTVSGVGAQSSNSNGQAEIRVFQITPDFEFGKVEVTEGGFSDFPDVLLNESRAIFYAIENHGGSDLEFTSTPPVSVVSGISGFSVFSQPNTFPIPAGNPEGFAKTFRIEFEPQVAAIRTARVFVFSNASNTVGPFDFTLRGRGVEPPVEIEDCNGNGTADDEDLVDGTSEDCNFNGIPDECDSDSDGDGVPDDCDTCPGEDDLRDSDGDGVADCLDECPNNADKTEAGVCGCGQADVDSDGDGTLDCEEVGDPGNPNPETPNPDDPNPGTPPPGDAGCGNGNAPLMMLSFATICGMNIRRRQGRTGRRVR